MSDLTYLICPDNDCDLFFDLSRPCPCESGCPKVDELKKMVVCWNCGEEIFLPGNHGWVCRIECECGAEMLRSVSEFKLVREG